MSCTYFQPKPKLAVASLLKNKSSLGINAHRIPSFHLYFTEHGWDIRNRHKELCMNQSPIVNRNQLNQCLVFMTLSSGLVRGEERLWTLAIVRASLRDSSRCNSYLGLQGGANVFIGGCGGLMKQVEEEPSLHLELL